MRSISLKVFSLKFFITFGNFKRKQKLKKYLKTSLTALKISKKILPLFFQKSSPTKNIEQRKILYKLLDHALRGLQSFMHSEVRRITLKWQPITGVQISAQFPAKSYIKLSCFQMHVIIEGDKVYSHSIWKLCSWLQEFLG